MKMLNLAIVIIVLVFGIAVGYGINNYITTENKEKVKVIEKATVKNHDDIKDLSSCVNVYKAEQDGKQQLLEQKLDRLEEKLDAIIKAINNNGGLLICDPIDTKNNEKKIP